MNHRSLRLFILLQCLFAMGMHAQSVSICGQVIDETQRQLEGVSVILNNGAQTVETDQEGRFCFENLRKGPHVLIFFLEGYQTQTEELQLKSNEVHELNIQMPTLEYKLAAIEIEAGIRQSYGLRRLRNVEGMAIYAAKKSEVIEMNNLVANMATNNPRQVYKGIPGLNIWESDGAGLQLSIGARGLDPNRTSNFNTRQNGYDISADALGYPESYYTPPTQALRRIEIVRGAASLQYGPQFGGLLNFVFKKGPSHKAFEFTTENTVGSFGLLNSFNSIGGSHNGWNYYAFFQRKQGDAWRDNSNFHQNTGYLQISKAINSRLTLGLETTHMTYLAQQPGGLQDFEFEQDPQQSKRARNWFQVKWNLSAFIVDYRLSDRTKINSRTFFLGAQREALGELGAINRPDPLRERDLIRGQYLNFGNETRLIHRYKPGKHFATFLLGVRYYQGHTRNEQGDADDGSDANFEFLNPDDLERSSYVFPSRNVSIFAENLFNLSDRWSVTPGARFEYIRTASDGFYKERVFSGNQLIFEQKFTDIQSLNRSIFLFGLGTGYKFKPDLELYANFSQNYRSINFSDLAVINPNLIVDSTLQDERGFNADLGLRGQLLNGAIRFDASLFYLSYQDRIGLGEIIVTDPSTVERAVAYRTNIGDARIVGLEAYGEADLWHCWMGKQHPHFNLSVFFNFSLLHGEYISGRSDFVGNDVELIPPFSLKTGLNLRYKNFRAAYQFAHVAEHYSDATNAEFVVNATRGIIPAYQVQDLSASYTFRRFRFQAGVNNLLDTRYFTRRATAYPGPGIIPADARNFYLTVGFKW